jgi:hypothetical protein
MENRNTRREVGFERVDDVDLLYETSKGTKKE